MRSRSRPAAMGQARRCQCDSKLGDVIAAELVASAGRFIASISQSPAGKKLLHCSSGEPCWEDAGSQQCSLMPGEVARWRERRCGALMPLTCSARDEDIDNQRVQPAEEREATVREAVCGSALIGPTTIDGQAPGARKFSASGLAGKNGLVSRGG